MAHENESNAFTPYNAAPYKPSKRTLDLFQIKPAQLTGFCGRADSPAIRATLRKICDDAALDASKPHCLQDSATGPKTV